MRFLFVFLISLLSFTRLSITVDAAFGIGWKPYSDRVVDIDNGRDEDGTTVHLWEPTGGNGNPGWTQLFEWVNGDQIRWLNSDKCLDVYNNDNPIRLWTCDFTSPRQKWIKIGDNIQWKGTNKCMNVLWGQHDPAGALLQVYDCTFGYRDEIFNIPPPPSFRIQWENRPDKVFATGGFSNGAGVGLAIPSGSNDSPSTQFFEWYNGDQLRLVGTSFCLDVAGGNNVIGNPIQVWSCADGWGYQRFAVINNGKQIQWKGTDKCLSTADSTASPLFQFIVLGTCDDKLTTNKFVFPRPPQFGIYLSYHSDSLLTIPSGRQSDGEHLMTWSAGGPNGSPGSNQLFEWINGEQIRWVGTNMCIDADEQIQLWSCDAKRNSQRWVRNGNWLKLKWTSKCIAYCTQCVKGNYNQAPLYIRECLPSSITETQQLNIAYQ